VTKAQYTWPGLDLVDGGIKRLANLCVPFYRAFPYTGPLWLTEIDMRVDISAEHKFIYNRLPKNANSTINQSLVRASLAPGDNMPTRPKHHFTRPSRLSRAQVADLGGYYKFTFVRNPYSRTLSAYLDKIVGRRAQSRAFYKWLARQPDQQVTFDAFCRYLDDIGLYHDNHWAPQTTGLVFPLAGFDFVGRFENLDADLDHVHQQIFAQPCTKATRAGPPATGSEAAVATEYTPTTRAIIARLFAEDFEAMGYSIAVA